MKKTTRNHLAGIFMLTAAAVLSTSPVIQPLAAASDTIITNTPSTGTLTITKTNMNHTAVKGAKYTAYKIMSLTPGKTAGEYASYAVTTTYADALKGVTADALGNYSAAKIEKLLPQLEAVAANDATGVKSESTGDNGSTKLTLDTGWYLIVETETPVGAIASLPFLVAIPSTNNIISPDGTETAGTEWDYSIEAAPKTSTVSVDKNIINGQGAKDSTLVSKKEVYTGKHDTAAVGDYIKYKITTSVPEYADAFFLPEDPPTFEFSDTLSKGLTILNDTNHPIKIRIGGTDTADGTLVEASEGGKTNFELSAIPQEDDTKADLTLKFTPDFLKNPLYRGKSLSIEYEAELNANAVMGKDGNTNNVIMTYNNKPNTETYTSPVPDGPNNTVNPDTRVYTYGIIVDKFSEAIGTAPSVPLEGAEFKLFKTSDDTAPAVQVTDTNGALTFPGLDAGTYYLKETKSPKGYSLLTNPIKVEIIPAQDATGKITGYGFTLKVNGTAITATDGKHVTKISTDSGKATIAIENHKGFTLPATGGSGIFFTISVSAAGLLAVTFYILKSKKKEE